MVGIERQSAKPRGVWVTQGFRQEKGAGRGGFGRPGGGRTGGWPAGRWTTRYWKAVGPWRGWAKRPKIHKLAGALASSRGVAPSRFWTVAQTQGGAGSGSSKILHRLRRRQPFERGRDCRAARGSVVCWKCGPEGGVPREGGGPRHTMIGGVMSLSSQATPLSRPGGTVSPPGEIFLLARRLRGLERHNGGTVADRVAGRPVQGASFVHCKIVGRAVIGTYRFQRHRFAVVWGPGTATAWARAGQGAGRTCPPHPGAHVRRPADRGPFPRVGRGAGGAEDPGGQHGSELSNRGSRDVTAGAAPKARPSVRGLGGTPGARGDDHKKPAGVERGRASRPKGSTTMAAGDPPHST